MSVDPENLMAMSKPELIGVITDLAEQVEALADELDAAEEHRNDLARQIASASGDLYEDIEALEDELQATEQTLHRERSKLMRRVSALEDEVGITQADALAVAEAGDDAQHLSKLARLIRHGPEAVAEQPSPVHYRAKTLVENWNRWGRVQNDAHGKVRRLASKEHDLRTRLEDARDESLQWSQVYRAMELVAEWSGGVVELRQTDDEGKVLVHTVGDGGDA